MLEIQTVSNVLSVADIESLLLSSPATMKEDKYGTLSTQFLTYEVSNEEKECMKYIAPKVVSVSRFTRAAVVSQFYNQCFREVTSGSPQDSAHLGATFEDLAFLLLTSGGKYAVQHQDNVRREEMNFELLETRLVATGADMKAILGRIGQDEEGKNKVLYATPQNFGMVDFVDSRAN